MSRALLERAHAVLRDTAQVVRRSGLWPDLSSPDGARPPSSTPSQGVTDAAASESWSAPEGHAADGPRRKRRDDAEPPER